MYREHKNRTNLFLQGILLDQGFSSTAAHESQQRWFLSRLDARNEQRKINTCASMG
jgi:hypothetical protein